HLWIEHDNPPGWRLGEYDASRNVLDDGFQARPFRLELRDQPLKFLPPPLTLGELRLQFNPPLYGILRPGLDPLTSDMHRLNQPNLEPSLDQEIESAAPVPPRETEGQRGAAR